MRARMRAARGFSLVELMVALAIGVIVVGGLVAVLMANRQAFTIQQGNNFNQENLRFASSRVAWSLRMADFWGGIKAGKITTTSNVTGLTGVGSCDGAWMVNVGPGATENGIRGYNGADTFPIANCVPDANYVKRSDVVVVRYADTHGYDPAKGAGTTAFDSDTTGAVPNSTTIFILSAIDQTGTIFRKGESVPTNPLGSASGRYVYPFQIEMYYLQPCSDPGQDNVCGTADDGDAGNPSPTLMRMRLDSSGKLISEAVVDGIEQMQFEYATPASTTPPTPTTFVPAGSVSDFSAITQVRVSLVARSATRDVRVPHPIDVTLSSDCSYSISNLGAISYPSLAAGNNCSGSPPSNYGDKPQQYVRIFNSQVVVLRNRVRG